MIREGKPGSLVQSVTGNRYLDKSGAAIGAARMDPQKGYGPVPKLLQDFINNGSENAWQEIRTRIDYLFITVSTALAALEGETGFSKDIKKRLKSGQKLFFKVNLVSLPAIDYQTHAPVMQGVCTPWEYTAAVMRWFHDVMDINYHQMCVGDAGSMTFQGAMIASRIAGEAITTEAVLEGKYGKNYGGWGFYFARKYLAECHDSSHKDDPMNGYQDSLAGICLPPGKVTGKLLVYDLNKITADNSRDVPVIDGINSKEITMHKVIVGGDPANPNDRRDWPGCVIVNLPKLKIHIVELFTCAIKNIGMGLYSTGINTSKKPGKYAWKYAVPDLKMPFVKMKLPHTRWIVDFDQDTLLPLRDKKGHYLSHKTGGMEGNMADTIQAVKGQNILMLHIVDAIETTNVHHCAPPAVPVPEGYVFAGLDIVAIDTCCGRYLFTNLPLDQIEEVRRKYNFNSDVIRKVPMPELQGPNIVTGSGYDSTFSRYHALKHCQDRGLGDGRFYVVGKDLWNGGSLASLRQRLGRVNEKVFSELSTSTLYQTPNKPLHDLQSTIFSYLELNDKLTGSNFKKQIIDSLDENGDGVIDFMEKGLNLTTLVMNLLGPGLMGQKLTVGEDMKLRFLLSAIQFKLSRPAWNSGGHNIEEHIRLEQALSRAFSMSQAREERPDTLFPGRIWGQGKWPSLQFVLQQVLFSMIYGQPFPDRFDLNMSPYGFAFNYADSKWNGAKYAQEQAVNRRQDVIKKYHDEVKQGRALLPFTVYVPKSFGSFNGLKIPNVQETDNPDLIMTASFGENEVWKEFRFSEYPLV